MNLKPFVPERYKRIVVSVVFENEEERATLASDAGSLGNALRFLQRGLDRGAVLAEIVWVLEEAEDYRVEKRVVIFP